MNEPNQPASGSQQQGLTDFDYSEHKKETPNHYTIQPIKQEDILSLVKGEQIWINGTTYTVVANKRYITAPFSKLVISEDGTQRELLAGKLSQQKDIHGVMWKSTLNDTDKPSRSDLEATYDDVYIVHQYGDLETFHTLIPEAPTRKCPNCDASYGTVKHHEIQNNTSIEVQVCNNSDCEYIYKHKQEIDHQSTAELIFRHDSEGKFELEPISGFYEVEHQDDYKVPMNTHDGIHDGFKPAEEIAEFLNKKMLTEGIADLLKKPSFSPAELLDLLDFTTPNEESTSADSAETEHVKWGTILNHHCETQLDLSIPKETIEQLSTADGNTFAKSLCAIYTAQEKQKQIDSMPTHQGTPEGPTITTDGGTLSKRDLNVLTPLLRGITAVPDNPIQRAIIQTYNQSLTGRNFLTSTPFYELIAKTADTSVLGKVSYDRGRFNHRSKTESDIKWMDDLDKYKKMVQVTYSKFDHHSLEPFSINYMWSMDQYDLTEHLAK